MKKNKILMMFILSLVCFLLGAVGIACNNNSEKDNSKEEINISLNSNHIVLEEGTTFVLEVFGTDEVCTFTSIDNSIAQVSTDGTITAINKGKTFIVVSFPKLDKKVDCAVEVSESGYQIKLSVGNVVETIINSIVEVEAQVYKNGKLDDKKVDWAFEGDCAQMKFAENKATITTDKLGFGMLKAQVGDVVVSCQFSVYPTDVTPLETPTIVSHSCDEIVWASVENADAYLVRAGNGAWKRVAELSYDLSDEAELLEEYTFGIKAVCDDTSYLSSEALYIEISHNFDKGTYKDATATCVDKTDYVYTCQDCGREKVEFDVYGPHNYIDAYCNNCKQYYDTTLIYEYSTQLNGFIVVDGNRVYKEKVVIPSTYSDSEHGEQPVVSVAEYAFLSNTITKEIVLPDSVKYLERNAFIHCSSLKTVIMPGVTTLYRTVIDEDGIERFQFMEEEQTQVNYRTFYNCVSLEVVVVNPDFVIGADDFSYYPSSYKYNGQLKLYVASSDVKPLTIWAPTRNENYMIGGGTNLSYYCFQKEDTCGYWDYIDGVPTLKEHDFIDGVCSCGVFDSEGLTYEYVEYADKIGYKVNGQNYTGEVVNIKPYFNDGANGLHEVLFIGAFYGNTNIKKVIAPKTVKYMGLRSFKDCTSLETAIIPGVTNLYVTTSTGLEYLDRSTVGRDFSTFQNCINLEKVVLNPNLVIGGEFYYDEELYPNYDFKLKLYIDSSEERPLIVNESGWQFDNNMINGGKDLSYYYFRKANTPGYWDYVDGEPTYLPKIN